MGKLILIDGNAILYRAYHALPPMTNRKGEPIGAIYGLVSMLLKVIQDLKPTHIAVCFDEKEKTFRHETLASYQAQRPPMPSELDYQFDFARRFLAAAGIPVYSKVGFEADDVIGTLANQSDEEVIIVTGDRDILQLVTEKRVTGPAVKVYMPVAGLAGGKLFGKNEVIERLGVLPSQVDDYKALVGDPSDNYPGVPGIGPKTAISLLEKFNTLDGIYKNLDKIPESTKKKLVDGEESGKISKKLATIVKDVPVKLELEECAKWDVDNQKVLNLFSEIGFKTLTERVKKVGKELDQEKQMPLL